MPKAKNKAVEMIFTTRMNVIVPAEIAVDGAKQDKYLDKQSKLIQKEIKNAVKMFGKKINIEEA